MTTLKPNVELETSTNSWIEQRGHLASHAHILDKIAWMIMRKERPPKNNYYPLPPRS